MADLTQRQIDAVVALLRAAADGEMASEQMRCRLAECQDFEPFRVFQILQGGWKNQRGHLSSYSVLRWLQSQPHNLCSAKIEDVSAMIAPYEGQLDELRYDGFLSLVLPKDAAHAWLKDSVMARGARSSWTSRANDDQMLPDVAYRLCQLFESEIDVARHLKFHRRSLMELGVALPSICKFLDKEQGICAGMGGLLSPTSLRHILVDNLKALTLTQCNSLLHRINPSGACLAPFHELAKVLGLGPPAFVPSSWTARSDYNDVLGSSRDTLGFSRDSFGIRRDDGLCFSPSRISPPVSPPVSPLKEPTGPFPPGYKADPVASIGLDTNGDGKVDTYIIGADRNRDGIPDIMQRQETSWLPSPTRLIYDEDVRADPLSRSIGTWSSSPITPRRYRGTQDLLSSKIQATPGDAKRFTSPFAHSSGLASTQASTADFLSPRSLHSWATPSPRRPWSYTTPLKDPGLPVRSSSVPAGRNASPSRISSSFRSPVDRRGSVSAVLRCIAQQAQLDAQMEDAKALLSLDTPLSGIFDALDQFRKGCITDADLWSFCQSFGGTTFGSLSALVREVQLRRPRDFSSVSGKLSFRDLASFVLKLDSPGYEAITNALSDDDARSISYILRNSDPCPVCGIRVQRDADSAGCPTVTCSICRTPFKCYTVLSDYSRPDFPLSVSAQYQLYRIVVQAANAACELENAREKLALFPGGDVMCALSGVFTHVGEGRLTISLDDLHRCFLDQNVDISVKELSFLRHRYGKTTSQVSFAEFVRQLSPRSSSLGL